VQKENAQKKKEKTKGPPKLKKLLGKVHITPSNYHTIVNVPPKLPIVSISSLKLTENVNVPIMTKMSFIKLLK
jgi:hypothetical protein